MSSLQDVKESLDRYNLDEKYLMTAGGAGVGTGIAFGAIAYENYTKRKYQKAACFTLVSVTCIAFGIFNLYHLAFVMKNKYDDCVKAHCVQQNNGLNFNDLR